MKSRVAEGRLQVLQIYKLLQHVHDGDKSRIETMVSMGVDQLINLTEPKQGMGVLHLASEANNTDMVSFLLSLGAHPNIQDRRGRTPVMLAAELGHIDMVTLLAESNADMSLVDSEGKGEGKDCTGSGAGLVTDTDTLCGMESDSIEQWSSTLVLMALLT